MEQANGLKQRVEQANGLSSNMWSRPSYGPMIYFRSLSTPPPGGAVTFGYRPQSACREGTCTPRTEYTLRRTGTAAFAVLPVSG